MAHARLIAVLFALLPLAPAQAGELFGGVYAHDVDTPLSLSGIEDGADVQIGVRGGRIGALRLIGRPRPHVFATVNTAGGASYASAGLSWTIGDRLFVRPGIGVAVHTNPDDPTRADRIDFGSRVLFAPEIGVGVRPNTRVSIEGSLIHLSHAQLFGPNNPGSDNFGVRLGYRF